MRPDLLSGIRSILPFILLLVVVLLVATLKAPEPLNNSNTMVGRSSPKAEMAAPQNTSERR